MMELKGFDDDHCAQCPEPDAELILRSELARSLRFRNAEFASLQQEFARLQSQLPGGDELDQRLSREAVARDLELASSSSYFDASWYLEHYPDVAAARMDPLGHYLTFGAAEGRDPSARFSSQGYLELRPDVAACGLNPLMHFLRFGITENLSAPPPSTTTSEPAPPKSVFNRQKNGKKALFVTHSTNVGGAPVILASVAKWFQIHTDYDVRILTMEGGPWLERFTAVAPTYLVGCHEVDAEYIEIQRNAIRGFVGDEPAFIFINSVAAGGFFDINPFDAPVFGYVHELERVIEIYRSAFDKFVAGVDYYFSAGPKVQKDFQDISNVSPNLITDRHTFIEVPENPRYLSALEKATIREGLGWPRGSLVVIGCGVVHWRKQPDVFIRVAAKVVASFGPDVRFIWVGDGPDLEALRQTVRELGLTENIHFVGHREDVSEILRAADVFAMTSMEDAFPLVCLEAAAQSVPSVIFRDATGAHAFVVPEGQAPAGVAVLLQDEDGFAEAIGNLLADDELRATMSQTAYDRLVKRYTVDSACGDLLRQIRELAGLTPRVTAILPNYNYESYLEQRLKSISDQSFKDIDIILLDDKSTDNSLAILEKFAKSNPGTQLFPSDENSGSPFLAWERGIKRATGDLIWIVEADDWCEPSFLELAVAAFGATDVRLVHGRSIPTTALGEIAGDYNEIYLNRIAKGRWDHSFVDTADNEINACLGRANTILNASGVVVRRDAALSAIKAAVSFKLAGDWAFYVAAIFGGKIAYVHEAVNYHRRHGDTVTRSIEGQQAYFQELANVGALVNHLYGPNPSRDAGLQKFIDEEASRFGFTKPLPVGRVEFELSESATEIPEIHFDANLSDGKDLFDAIAKEIAVSDSMYDQDPARYYAVGASALSAVLEALDVAGVEKNSIRRVLDYACGYGRVLRWLRASFPDAYIKGVDADRASIEGAAVLDADTALLDVSLSETLGEPFDLIWVGSLFTHLTLDKVDRILGYLRHHLSDTGVLVFSTHGIDVAERLRSGERDYQLEPAGVQAVIEDFTRTGYGYADYSDQPGYGISAVQPAAMRQLLISNGLTPIMFRPCGWDNHQDVFACTAC